MSKRRYRLDKDGKPQVPWFNRYTLADWNGDGEAFAEYLDLDADRYEEIQAKLRPGQPHPMHYENEWDDSQYQSDVRIWEHEVASERVAQRHAPRPSAPPIDKHRKAFLMGSGEDKKEAQERLEMQRFIQEQLEAAVEHRALGHIKQARDCEERAAMWTRDFKKRDSQPYTFEAAEEAQIVDFGDRNLSERTKWSAQDLAERFDETKGWVEGFRQMSPTEYSYVLTGEGDTLKLSKVKHPGIPAHDLKARVGDIGEENLLLKLGVNGAESREEPEPEKKESPKPMTEMTMGDYNKYVAKEQAKEAEKSQSSGNEVAPGMFGG